MKTTNKTGLLSILLPVLLLAGTACSQTREESPEVKSLQVSPSSLSLVVGETEKLSLKIEPVECESLPVNWRSSKPDVASVSKDGLVEALKEGVATITATVGKKESSCRIEVTPEYVPVTGVSLNKTTLTLLEGNTEKLEATVIPSNATNQQVTWRSTDESVATVDDNGLVKAIKHGEAKIMAITENCWEICIVTVESTTIPVYSITLSDTELELIEGYGYVLYATIEPKDATDKTVVWRSTQESVAKVENGEVWAISPGKATIIAEAGGKTAECEVTVKSAFIPVSSVTLDHTSLELFEGETSLLTAVVGPEDATDKEVIWKSSDASIASVDYGLVKALSPGTATITASAGGVTAACSVTVTRRMPKMVDLGLSVMWADCNLGAYVPEDPGDFYAWGELEPKTDYSWSTYRFGTYYELTKYNDDEDNGFVDNRTLLEAEDDVASIIMGDLWRLPTREDVEELTATKWNPDYRWEYMTVNGRNGLKVTYLAKGNSVFFPMADSKAGTHDQGSNWEYGAYWSSTISYNFIQRAMILRILSDGPTVFREPRDMGLMVRPVYGNLISVTGITLDHTNITITEGEKSLIEAKISPANAAEKGVSWSSSDVSVATVVNGSVQSIGAGSATITATSVDGNFTAHCEVTVQPKEVYSDVIDGDTVVDLGLSVKWCACNLGASRPEEEGFYFAWGEVEPKERYSWEEYKWCNGTSVTLTKYNSMGQYGTVDDKGELELEDDAANDWWGRTYRIPTYTEIKELYNSCTWELETRPCPTTGHMRGYKVTGPNGNSIFLPFAGLTSDDSRYHVTDLGFYWTSTIWKDDNQCARLLYITEDGIQPAHLERCEGLPIRAVAD